MNRLVVAVIALAMLLVAPWAVADNDVGADATTSLVAGLAAVEGPEVEMTGIGPVSATDDAALRPIRAPAGYKKIVCIGDCVTKGVWWSEEVGSGTCWVDKFAAREKGVEVVNAGRDALESKHFWYVKEVLRENPDATVFVLYLGINDLRGIKDLETEAAVRVAGRVGYMIDLIRQKSPTAQVLVVAPQRIDQTRLSEKWRKEGFGEHTATMTELMAISLQRVAEQKQALFLGLNDKITGKLLPDGVHPGVAGHTQIAEAIYSAMHTPVVKKSAPIYAEAKKTAPPAEGKPYISMSGTDAVVAGIQGDLLAMKGPEISGRSGRSLSVAPQAEMVDRLVSGFVSERDSAGFVSDEACRLGMATGEAIALAATNDLIWQEEVGVQRVYDNLERMTGDGNTIRIESAIPVEPRAEGFVTQIILPDDAGYEVLGEAVDWNQVEVPSVYNNVILDRAAHTAQKAQEDKIALAKVAARDLRAVVQEPRTRIEDMQDACLPELVGDRAGEILLPGGSLVPGIPSLSAFGSEVAEYEQAEPESPGLPPLEVPGYAVFVHTRPERL